MQRCKVLVVAGYDPSGGAGVLADIKTLEAHAVYGYAVCTAITWQNERVIRRVDWMAARDVFGQIDVCFEADNFDWVKLGITTSVEAAGGIVRHLKQRNQSVKIVWDPVIRASSGADFWKNVSGWQEVAAQCYLMTPNWEEMKWLASDEETMKQCGCHLYLKGGHHPEHPGRDYLWSGGVLEVLDPGGEEVYPKHGSGCVLASALTANLALGYPLPESARRAKGYVERFLSSNKSLLGWHQ